jgi:hypothetical protein
MVSKLDLDLATSLTFRGLTSEVLRWQRMTARQTGEIGWRAWLTLLSPVRTARLSLRAAGRRCQSGAARWARWKASASPRVRCRNATALLQETRWSASSRKVGLDTEKVSLLLDLAKV